MNSLETFLTKRGAKLKTLDQWDSKEEAEAGFWVTNSEEPKLHGMLFDADHRIHWDIFRRGYRCEPYDSGTMLIYKN